MTIAHKSLHAFAVLQGLSRRRGFAWGLILLAALLAFEVFNYSTTEFALTDILGDLRFLGLRWATILALAFCGMDFAGVARLFTPEQGREEPVEVWYLFGAWLLAAAMNAGLTWWGVATAIATHSTQAGGVVVGQSALTKGVPVLVAILVWLIRVLLIGTFATAGERLFTQAERREGVRPALPQAASGVTLRPRPVTAPAAAFGGVRSGQAYASSRTGYRAMSARAAREVEYVEPEA